MKTLDLTLTEPETKIVLASLMARERHLAEVCERAEDDDVIADAGNDLVELRLLVDTLRERAVAAFGESVLGFSGQSL